MSEIKKTFTKEEIDALKNEKTTGVATPEPVIEPENSVTPEEEEQIIGKLRYQLIFPKTIDGILYKELIIDLESMDGWDTEKTAVFTTPEAVTANAMAQTTGTYSDDHIKNIIAVSLGMAVEKFNRFNFIDVIALIGLVRNFLQNAVSRAMSQ